MITPPFSPVLSITESPEDMFISPSAFITISFSVSYTHLDVYKRQDEMLYELVEKVVIHSASGGRTIYRQQQIDIYFNFIGDTSVSYTHLTWTELLKTPRYQPATYSM